MRSSKPLYMLVFFTSIATVIFSSLIHYVERGQWNEELEMWMRLYLYYCPVKAGADVGPAVKNPSNWTSTPADGAVQVGGSRDVRRERDYPSEALSRARTRTSARASASRCTSSRRTTASPPASGGAW